MFGKVSKNHPFWLRMSFPRYVLISRSSTIHDSQDVKLTISARSPTDLSPVYPWPVWWIRFWKASSQLMLISCFLICGWWQLIWGGGQLIWSGWNGRWREGCLHLSFVVWRRHCLFAWKCSNKMWSNQIFPRHNNFKGHIWSPFY